MDPSELRAPSSAPEVLAFAVFAAVAVVGALMTVISKNPIRSAVGLFFHVLALAGLYVTLSAHFLAVIQLIVYAGAVVVLFVFVIMILGPAAETTRDRRALVPRVLAGLAVVGTVLMVVPHVGYIQRAMPNRPGEYGTLWQVGHYLFHTAVLPFELVSVLLVVAMVGAMAIARGPHRKALGEADGPADHHPKGERDRLVAPLDPMLSTRDARVVTDEPDATPPTEGHS